MTPTSPLQAFKENLRSASADGVVDGPEMERALEGGAPSARNMRAEMYDVVAKGGRFSERARNIANSAVQHALLKPPRQTSATAKTPTQKNAALIEVDTLLQKWLTASAVVDVSQAQELYPALQVAILDAEHPEAVRRYLTARLRQVHDVMGQPTSGPGAPGVAKAITDAIELLSLDDVNVEGDEQITLSQSEFERGTTELEDSSISGYWGHRKTATHFTWVLNDLVADGNLSKEDADYFVARFTELSREPHTVFGIVWWFKDHDVDSGLVQSLKANLASLPLKSVENGAIEIIESWLATLQDDDRISAYRRRCTGTGSSDITCYKPTDHDPSLRLPFAVPESRVPAADNEQAFADRRLRSAEIREAAEAEDTPIEKIRSLLRIAHEAKDELSLLMTELHFEDANYPVATVEESRQIFAASSSADLDASSQSRSHGRVASLMLLAFGSQHSSSSSSMQGGSRAHAKTVEYTGTTYDLSPALNKIEDPRLRARVGEAYIDAVVDSIKDIHHALSAAVHLSLDVSDAELDANSHIIDKLEENLKWAATTKFRAIYRHDEIYRGPGQPLDQRSVGIDRVVYPRLLGSNH